MLTCYGESCIKISSVIRRPAKNWKDKVILLADKLKKIQGQWLTCFLLKSWAKSCCQHTLKFIIIFSLIISHRDSIEVLVELFAFSFYELYLIVFCMNTLWITCYTCVDEANDWTGNQSSDRYRCDNTSFFWTHGTKISNHHPEWTQVSKSTNSKRCDCNTAGLLIDQNNFLKSHSVS